MKFKLPSSSYNWISLSGAVVALISLFMIIFLFAISYFSGQGGSYLGLVIYIILPAFLIGGLILIPVGMLKNFNKHKDEEKRLPFIDLNRIDHRNAFLIFISGESEIILSAFILLKENGEDTVAVLIPPPLSGDIVIIS